MRHPSFLARLRLLALLALAGTAPFALTAHADGRDEAEVDDSTSATHDVGRACAAYLDVRASDFQSSGRDAPAMARVFVGRTEVFPNDAGVYRVALTTAEGRWREVDFDRRHLQRNGLPKGALVIVPTGHGRVLQGLYGFMSRGEVAVKWTSTVVGAQLLRVKNDGRARFERQGDGRYELGRPGQDEFVVAGNVITSYATVTSHGDFNLARVTCRGAVDPCAGVTCSPRGPCRAAGVCDPATGACSDPPAEDGATCDDQNACTSGDACQGGVCIGSPVSCDDANPCTADSCDPLQGCVSKPDDSLSCSDDNACTQSDYCYGGLCQSGAQTQCALPEVCRAAGVCNPADGLCEHAVLNDGSPCPDGQFCNGAETCQSGSCTPGAPPTCANTNPCAAAYCDEQAASCVTANVVIGTACGVGLACNGQGACLDVDECTAGMHNCHVNATCTNTPGGFTCACKPGYSGNGVQCAQPIAGVIDPTARAGNMSLRAAPGGKLIVVYGDAAVSPSPMKVATYDGAWSTVVAAPDASFGNESAAVDAQGRVHAAIARADGLFYITNASGAWVTQAVTGIPLSATGAPTADLDDDGFFHVTSARHVQSPGRYYAHNRSGTWSASQVATSATNTAAIVAAGVPNPVLVHAEWARRRIDFMTAPNFGSKTTLYNYGVDQGPSISMVVDRGVPTVAYGILPGGYGSLTVLLEVRQANGTFARTTLAAGVPQLNGIDLAIDGAGRRFVTTCNTAGALTVYSDVSGAWVTTSLGTATPNTIDTLIRGGVYYLVYSAAGSGALTMLTRDANTL